MVKKCKESDKPDEGKTTPKVVSMPNKTEFSNRGALESPSDTTIYAPAISRNIAQNGIVQNMVDGVLYPSNTINRND